MTLLQTFQMITLRPGWVELPASYAEALMAKGAGHKYIKRVPKAGGGYRYFYHVAHGGGVHAEEHFVEGAAFRHDGGHYHVTKVDGSRVTVRHDESGKTETFTRAELASALREHHAGALKAHHDKATKDLADAKAAGASAKQIAKLEKRVKVAGGGHAGSAYVVGHGQDEPPEGAGPDNPDNPWFQDKSGKWHDEKAVMAQQDRAWQAHSKVAREMELAAADKSKTPGRRAAEAFLANRFRYEHNDGNRQRFIDRFSDPANQPKRDSYGMVEHDVLTREDITSLLDNARAKVGADVDAPYVDKALHDLAVESNHARYWAEKKRTEEALKPRKEAIRALEADALVPISDAEAAAVDPKKELASIVSHLGSSEVVSEPIQFSSAKDSRVSSLDPWPKSSGVPVTIYRDGKTVTGITANVKRIRYHEDAPPMTNGTLRAPKTPDEYAAVAEQMVSDAKKNLAADYRTAAEYGGVTDAVLGRAEGVARAQKALTAIRAHARVSAGQAQEAPATPAAPKAAAPPPKPPEASSGGALTAHHHARASKLGLTLSQSGRTVHVGGSGTYAHKDTRIKPAGGRWDPDRRGWKVPVENIGAMLKGSITPAEWFAWVGS